MFFLSSTFVKSHTKFKQLGQNKQYLRQCPFSSSASFLPKRPKIQVRFFSHFNYQHMILSRILPCNNFKLFEETGEAEFGAETLELS